MKCLVRKKIRENRVHATGTGGGPAKTMALTAKDEQIAALLDLERGIIGIPSVQAHGLASDSEVEDVVPSLNEEWLDDDGNISDEELAQPIQTESLATPARSATPRAPKQKTMSSIDLIKKQGEEAEKRHMESLDAQNKNTAALLAINQTLLMLVAAINKQ